MTSFISYDLLAMTIIEIKRNVFDVEYTTLSEFHYVRMELQKEFNKKQIDIIIHSDFGHFDPDNLKVQNNTITIVDNPLINYVPNSRLSDYFYIIAEIIMEYSEKELKEKQEKFNKFKNENDAFEAKQESLLKRLQYEVI